MCVSVCECVSVCVDSALQVTEGTWKVAEGLKMTAPDQEVFPHVLIFIIIKCLNGPDKTFSWRSCESVIKVHSPA